MNHEAMEVSNRSLASDGGQASCVAISERGWRGTSLESSADHFGDIATALFRRGREAGNGLSAPRKAGGYVANREDAGQIGLIAVFVDFDARRRNLDAQRVGVAGL